MPVISTKSFAWQLALNFTKFIAVRPSVGVEAWSGCRVEVIDSL
jgi:hypothetical protein